MNRFPHRSATAFSKHPDFKRIACYVFIFVYGGTLQVLLFRTNGALRQMQTACAENTTKPINFGCIVHVLKHELPISERTVKNHPGFEQRSSVAFAHHYDAGRSLWNEEERFMPEHTLRGPGCSIWEVGANIKASDSRQFMSIFPDCQFHAYEAVPQFADSLLQHWSNEKGATQLHIHAYGLGGRSRTFTMHEASLAGQSTFIQESYQGNISVQVKTFDEAVEEAHGIPTMISLNCEGCEWDLLRAGLDSGFLQQVSVIQIGWHNYGEHIGERVLQLCTLRQRLGISHDFVTGVAFGWERWRKRM